jgi:hypothetical protein
MRRCAREAQAGTGERAGGVEDEALGSSGNPRRAFGVTTQKGGHAKPLRKQAFLDDLLGHLSEKPSSDSEKRSQLGPPPHPSSRYS